MAYPSISLSRADAVARARRICADVARGVAGYYRLGRGGRDPSKPEPYTGTRQSDCSGFVAWVLGYDRSQPGGVDVYTSHIELEAKRGKPLGWFAAKGDDEPIHAGDVLNYGHWKKPDGTKQYGHVGLVVEAPPGISRRDPLWWQRIKVAHCSPGNSRKFGEGHAIAETDAVIWRKPLAIGSEAAALDRATGGARPKGSLIRFTRYVDAGDVAAPAPLSPTTVGAVVAVGIAAAVAAST